MYVFLFLTSPKIDVVPREGVFWKGDLKGFSANGVCSWRCAVSFQASALDNWQASNFIGTKTCVTVGCMEAGLRRRGFGSLI